MEAPAGKAFFALPTSDVCVLCFEQLPTQTFFTETFGLPLTMNPNFETLECDMLFGVAPPPVEDDAVYGETPKSLLDA